MRILNLGSLNLDRVCNVDHFVVGGETILADDYETFCGGKGLNQSIALARAGAEVYHAGAVGNDGEILRRLLEESGVNISCLQTLPTVSGHAVIQLTPCGQNAIIVCGGANRDITKEYIDHALDRFGPGDILLLQNEISNGDYAIQSAKKRGLLVAFNASPITESLPSYPLELVDFFLINEVEGQALSGSDDMRGSAILSILCARFPDAAVVLTLGERGARYQKGICQFSHGTYQVPVVDTTAAGDTFCGFFIASIAKGRSPDEALKYASLASSVAISRRGAANSIPTWKEMEQQEFVAKLKQI